MANTRRHHAINFRHPSGSSNPGRPTSDRQRRAPDKRGSAQPSTTAEAVVTGGTLSARRPPGCRGRQRAEPRPPRSGRTGTANSRRCPRGGGNRPQNRPRRRRKSRRHAAVCGPAPAAGLSHATMDGLPDRSAGWAGSDGSQHGIALGGDGRRTGGGGSPFLTLDGLRGHWMICAPAAPSAVAPAGRLCRTAKRGAHAALTGTDGACDTLAADNLDTGLARVQVMDVTLAVTFRAGLLNARPRQARLLQRCHHRRCRADTPESEPPGPGRADYIHWAPPDRTGVRRRHIGKNPLTLWPGRPWIAIGGRMIAAFSIGTLRLHVAQYPPCELVSWKPKTPRRSLITVSSIVGPPHRLHSIAMSSLRLSFSSRH